MTLEGLPQSVLQTYIFLRVKGIIPGRVAHADALSGVSIDLLLRSLVLSLVGFTKVRRR